MLHKNTEETSLHDFVAILMRTLQNWLYVRMVTTFNSMDAVNTRLQRVQIRLSIWPDNILGEIQIAKRKYKVLFACD